MSMLGSSYKNEKIVPSPTCCQPAQESGPIKWDEVGDMIGAPDKVEMKKLSIKEEKITEEEKQKPNTPPDLFEKETEFPLKVCGIAGSLGVYGIGTGKKKNMRFKWNDGEKAWELEMSPEDWRRFITEMLQFIRCQPLRNIRLLRQHNLHRNAG